MRAVTGVGLAVLAALVGYGVSQLRVESVRTDAPVAARLDPAAAPAASVDPAGGSGENAPGSAAAPASFVHEGPNMASYTAPATFAALPPESMPLAQSLEALAAAMRTGSREATLRLLKQTRECDRYAEAQRQLNFAIGVEEAIKAQTQPGRARAAIIVSDGSAPDKPMEGMARGSATTVATHEAQCAGFSDPDDALRFEAQWRAALMGDLVGLLEFSLDPAIDRMRAFEQFDRIERYRERAPGFIQQAVALHSAQAVANLMQAHNPVWVPLTVRRTPDMPAHMREMVSRFETPPLGQVVGRDAAAAYRYARLCERICPDPHRADAEAITRALRERLDNAARERAEAEADRLRDQHFPDAGRAEWFDFIRDDTQIPPRG